MDAEQAISQAFIEQFPIEAAGVLERMPVEDVLPAVEPLPPPLLAALLEAMTSATAGQVLLKLPRARAVQMLAQLPASVAESVLRRMTAEDREAILSGLEPGLALRMREALAFPAQTAAGIADTQSLALPSDLTAEEALAQVRLHPDQVGYYVYVTDRQQRLEGVVTLKQLLLAADATRLATIIGAHPVSLPPDANLDEITHNRNWSRFHTLPVENREHVFLGALRYRTVHRLAEESQLQAHSQSLAASLMQLWEAFTLLGIGFMTDMSQVMEAVAAGAPKPGEPDDKESR